MKKYCMQSAITVCFALLCKIRLHVIITMNMIDTSPETELQLLLCDLDNLRIKHVYVDFIVHVGVVVGLAES